MDPPGGAGGPCIAEFLTRLALGYGLYREQARQTNAGILGAALHEYS